MSAEKPKPPEPVQNPAVTRISESGYEIEWVTIPDRGPRELIRLSKSMADEIEKEAYFGDDHNQIALTRIWCELAEKLDAAEVDSVSVDGADTELVMSIRPPRRIEAANPDEPDHELRIKMTKHQGVNRVVSIRPAGV